MKKHTPTSFMNEKKVGLLVRGFAKKSEDVPNRVVMMDELITRALSAKVIGKPLIRRVDILIWANQTDYPGEVDSGELAPALKEHFKEDRKIFVHEVRSGDLFCSILNYGIAKQLRAGCDYSVIASAEANKYWASDIPQQMVQAACDGAYAIGVAINELTESIMDGRIANTMSMFHNENVMTCGGFDLRAKKPKDDREAFYLKGKSPEGENVFYHLGGVEEMVPLARLVEMFGQCIAPIQSSDPSLRYELPDPKKDPELYARHMAKFGTKTERQLAHLALAGYDFSFLRGGVMRNYGWRAPFKH